MESRISFFPGNGLGFLIQRPTTLANGVAPDDTPVSIGFVGCGIIHGVEPWMRMRNDDSERLWHLVAKVSKWEADGWL